VSRALTRAATTGLAGLVTVLLTAAPALADNPIGPAEGADPGDPMGLGKTLLLYIGTPVLAYALVASAAWLPGTIRSHRYRPAQGWTAPPVWFAGPVDADAAVAAAAERGLGDVTRGGASGSW
jgi:hypothetical protein